MSVVLAMAMACAAGSFCAIAFASPGEFAEAAIGSTALSAIFIGLAWWST